MSYQIAAAPYGENFYISYDNGITYNTYGTDTVWSSIASSSDGITLVACDGGFDDNYEPLNGSLYSSIDGGRTWSTISNIPEDSWISLACSSDGTKFVVATYGGRLVTLQSSGGVWSIISDYTPIENGTTYNWYTICASSDCSILAVAGNRSNDYLGYIYTSINSGATWVKQTGSGQCTWQSVACSSNGSFMVAVEYGGYIYTSNNSGVTWTRQNNSPNTYWNSVCCSSDGTKLAACDYGVNDDGYIWTSSDSGVTWTKQTGPGALNWYFIGCSQDGTFLAACENIGYIWTSSDSGVTWSNQDEEAPDNSWSALAISASSAPICLVGTTRITMADGSQKMIKDIVRGDRVLTNKEKNTSKPVARLLKNKINGTATVIPKGKLGNTAEITITNGHPVWVNGDKNRVFAKNIRGCGSIPVADDFYNIQFEEEETYYAEGLRMDAMSPNFYAFKLPRKLYFYPDKYNANLVIREEDDTRRNKPEMIRRI